MTMSLNRNPEQVGIVEIEYNGSRGIWIPSGTAEILMRKGTGISLMRNQLIHSEAPFAAQAQAFKLEVGIPGPEKTPPKRPLHQRLTTFIF